MERKVWRGGLELAGKGRRAIGLTMTGVAAAWKK
jgi:hypothetical protein